MSSVDAVKLALGWGKPSSADCTWANVDIFRLLNDRHHKYGQVIVRTDFWHGLLEVDSVFWSSTVKEISTNDLIW